MAYSYIKRSQRGLIIMLDEMDNRGYKVITANSTSEKVSGHIQISYMDSGEIVFEKDDN